MIVEEAFVPVAFFRALLCRDDHDVDTYKCEYGVKVEGDSRQLTPNNGLFAVTYHLYQIQYLQKPMKAFCG